MSDRCVLAYSGGLDTSVVARSLREERGLEVIAAFVDLGQPYVREEVEERAAAAHAELSVVDAREAFAREQCLPAIHANALYEGKYPLVSALARPLIAAEVVRLAREQGARFVAHGCTGKGNDQVRFETSFAALAPDLAVLAPIREGARSRADSLERAAAWGIPLPEEASRYSVDENLWGRTIECGELEDPWVEAPPDAFALTAGPPEMPVRPAEVVVGFESGTPVSLDGERLGLMELVAGLTALGGRHGFGRVDMVENRLVGIKSRELYEVPGALALILAHRELEDLTLERDLAHEKAGLERRWAELCYYGQWHGPLHAALRAFMAETQADVTGEVRLRFSKGSCVVVGRRSPRSLYDLSLATYEESGDRFDHQDAEGFIRLWSLPIRTWAGRDGAPADPASSSPEPPRPAAAPETRNPSARSVENPEPEPVWSGRLATAPTGETKAFLDSLPFDRRLLPEDLAATRAHVAGLAAADLLTEEERERLVHEIDRLVTEADAGTFPFHEEDEDVHSAVERVLTQRLGDAGARIHAGRSRNDLVAADLRLWSKRTAGNLARAARKLAGALGDRAEEHAETFMPGYTHLQRAQPITLGHHLLAHAFPLVRDAERLEGAATAADVSPLGAGALAGSSLGLDPEVIARELGFARTFDNSMDAVSDRDFALDLLHGCVSTALHVSRLCEDVVLWCSSEFGFATPGDGYATGSSMMPQKRNPDVAELARAKAGRILGSYVRLAMILKGLPLAYDRDLQEDKEAVFDAVDAMASALSAMTGMIRTLEFDEQRLREAASDPALLATDMAESLVRRGIPFREAHRTTGNLVKAVESEGRTLADLNPGEWPNVHPNVMEEVYPLDSRKWGVRSGIVGALGPGAIRKQLSRLRAQL